MLRQVQLNYVISTLGKSQLSNTDQILENGGQLDPLRSVLVAQLLEVFVPVEHLLVVPEIKWEVAEIQSFVAVNLPSPQSRISTLCQEYSEWGLETRTGEMQLIEEGGRS